MHLDGRSARRSRVGSARADRSLLTAPNLGAIHLQIQCIRTPSRSVSNSRTPKIKSEQSMNRWIALCFCLAAISCRQNDQRANPHSAAQVARIPDPLSLALAPHQGSGRVDQEIIRVQTELRRGKGLDSSLERLGWLFVAKARESFDAGYYKLAEQCALALEAKQSNRFEALLLRG